MMHSAGPGVLFAMRQPNNMLWSTAFRGHHTEMTRDSHCKKNCIMVQILCTGQNRLMKEKQENMLRQSDGNMTFQHHLR